MLPRVFDLFAQADRALHRAQGGLGIGLALVRRLVELHGGQVEAHSAGTGHGSEFIVRLPLPAEPKLTQHNGSHAPPAPGVRPLRVLIVDDSEDTAESLAMILRLANHEVHIAHDGPGALVIAQATPHDIVLLDIGLPGMDGYEVARRLRQLPGMEEAMLVAITGFGQDEHRRRALEAGIDAYLTKPAAPEKVQELLAKSRKPQAHPPRDGA